MPEWGDEERGGEDRPGGTASGLLAASLRLSAHMLEREQDRWFLWLPMLFAGGIITYFALADEPAARVALYIEGLPIRTETVAAWRGHRPWVPDRASVRSTPNSRLEPFVDEGADAADRGNSGNPEE